MKSVPISALLRMSALLLLTFFSTSIFAQDGLNRRANTPIPGGNSNGHLDYRPIGYTASAIKYPLMIYIPGANSNGDGSDPALNLLFTGSNAPHEQQQAGSWVDEYTVGGQSFRFVIVTPQFIRDMITAAPTPQEMNAIVDYAISSHPGRIDTTRIYLFGQSQGAGFVWDYPAYSSFYANRIAAIVPFSGVMFPTQEKANRLKYARTAVWAFHNSNDPSVPYSFSADFVNFYNAPPPPAIPAKLTTFTPTPPGHISWIGPLGRAPIPGEPLNIYEWALQYSRTHTTVFAGEDQTIEIPANSVQLGGSGTGPNGTTTTTVWTKVSGPAAGTLSNTTILNPTANGLVQGTYTFRLTITDNSSASFTDDVTITVNPGFQRIQAESYVASSGLGTTIVNEPTSDPDGASNRKIDHIGNTGVNKDWVEYDVTVPAAGTYKFRFRVGTFYGGTSFKIKDNGGNVLDTVFMYATSADTYMNLWAYNVTLAAGTQRIRIENGDIPSGGDTRVWFMNYFDIIDNTLSQGPLPVNFSAFNVACNNGAINLVWKTAGEKDTKNFTVEKSSNGNTWTVIATIAADGQTSAEKTYSFKDAGGSTNSLYRIVGNDIDGKKSYTSILRGNCSGKQTFSVYPNPVKDKAVATINLLEKSAVQILLIDNKGATVRKTDNQLPAGTSSVTVDMNGLPTGTYTMIARWNNEVQTVKLIKN